MINAREVKRLVAQGEGPLLEFKPGDERPLGLATTLAALANAEGGTLVVGITERMLDGRVVSVIEGVNDPKRALDHLHTAAGLCDPKMDLLPPERVVVDGRTVLVVTIPEGLADAYSVEGRFQARWVIPSHAQRRRDPLPVEPAGAIRLRRDRRSRRAARRSG